MATKHVFLRVKFFSNSIIIRKLLFVIKTKVFLLFAAKLWTKINLEHRSQAREQNKKLDHYLALDGSEREKTFKEIVKKLLANL